MLMIRTDGTMSVIKQTRDSHKAWSLPFSPGNITVLKIFSAVAFLLHTQRPLEFLPVSVWHDLAGVCTVGEWK